VFSAFAMNADPAPTSADRRRHAGRTGHAARIGLVAAVVAVTGAVGVGTWVLGSGADATPQIEPAPAARSTTIKSEPPLSIAPPPAEREKPRASRTVSRTMKRTADR
jgi:hypothetical protein